LKCKPKHLQPCHFHILLLRLAVNVFKNGKNACKSIKKNPAENTSAAVCLQLPREEIKIINNYILKSSSVKNKRNEKYNKREILVLLN
jgi:hypothetical protein